MAIHKAVQSKYSDWLKAQGRIPDLWDEVDFPDGFDRVWVSTPPGQFRLQLCIAGVLWIEQQSQVEDSIQ